MRVTSTANRDGPLRVVELVLCHRRDFCPCAFAYQDHRLLISSLKVVRKETEVKLPICTSSCCLCPMASSPLSKFLTLSPASIGSGHFHKAPHQRGSSLFSIFSLSPFLSFLLPFPLPMFYCAVQARLETQGYSCISLLGAGIIWVCHHALTSFGNDFGSQD